MKNNILHIILLLTISFLTSIYATDKTIVKDLVYKKVKGRVLKYDIYEPVQKDMTKKPLVIFLHGGGFHAGEKHDPKIVELCERMSDSGYVAAAIEYRTGIKNYTVKDFFRALMVGVYDAGDFLNHIIKLSNRYNFDSNKIFIGGISSGAIVALHLAYLDLPEANKYMADKNIDLTLPARLDSFPDISGVLNCWGLLLDPSIMKNNNIPIVTVHGKKDRVVPYKKGKPMHIPWLPKVYGGYTIHESAKKSNITSLFHTYPKIKHGHEENCAYMDTTFHLINNFVQNISQDQIQNISLFVKDNINTIFHIRQNDFPNKNTATMLVE